MKQVEVLNEVVHGSLHLQPGRIELPASTAADLEKAGHVKVLGDVEQKAAPVAENKAAPEPKNKAK